MKNTAFSLMTALLAVMNESEPKDPYYVLAQYFLYHFDQLRDLNIYDVADACYVSRSGIRRFCQSIGFDNFSDLKAEADEWKRQCNYFIGYSVRPDYKEHLSGSIGEMMEEINRIATPAVLDKLAESIHASRHVVLFTSDFSGMAEEGGLFISSVRQSAYLEVNEQGTRAAAATVVAMAGSALETEPPVDMTVNRPYILLVYDAETNSILFAAVVSDPSIEPAAPAATPAP